MKSVKKVISISGSSRNTAVGTLFVGKHPGESGWHLSHTFEGQVHEDM